MEPRILLADRYTKLDKIKGTSADISDMMSKTRSALSQFKPRIGRLAQTNKSSLRSSVRRDLQASTGSSDYFFQFSVYV